MGFFKQLETDIGKRYPKAIAPKDGPQPPGRFSFGAQTYGGPQRTDAFGARPAPSQVGLVERYNALIYAMVGKSKDGVTRVPMRLLADGSRAQGRPTRACDPIKISRSAGKRLAQKGAVSNSAVDQIYEVRQHPLIDVIDNPDPYGNFSRKKLIGLMVAFEDVVGSGILVPEGRGWDWRKDLAGTNNGLKGPPENLWVIYSQYAIPVRLSASPQVDHFQYFSDWLPFQSVLWFRRNVSLRDCYGASFSPTYAGEPYRQQEQELVSILSQVLGIGPRPNLIVSAKDAMVGMTPTQKLAYEQDLVRKHAGYGAGGVLVLDGSIDVTPIDYPKADIAARDIAQHDRDNLASIFGMPPTYFTVDSNLANLQAADAQFAKFNTEPRCDDIAEMFTRLAQMCDPRLFFAFDPVIAEDEESTMKVVQMRIASGLTTPNQENEEGKWPAYEGGDEHFIDGKLKPISGVLAEMKMAQEQHEQGLEQGQQAIDQADEESAIGELGASDEESDTSRSLDRYALGILRSINAELDRYRTSA